MEIYKAEYTHAGAKSINEDSILCRSYSRQCLTAAAADGAGTHGGGAAASRMAVNHLAGLDPSAGLPSAELFRSALAAASQEIQSLRGQDPQLRSSAAVLSISGNQAQWASVGTCRLFHYLNGQPLFISPRPVAMAPALGDSGAVPECLEREVLAPGRHAFLLCTPGFWEYLRDGEIMLDLYKSQSPEAWLTYLRCRGETRKGESGDNNSAIAIWADI